MRETRLNVRIEGVLHDHVEAVIRQGLYSNQSEYVRDLIRHDMASQLSIADQMTETILQSHDDIINGRVIESTGDYYEDKKLLDEKRKNGWE